MMGQRALTILLVGASAAGTSLGGDGVRCMARDRAGFATLPEPAQAMVVRDGLAYLVTGGDDLRIFDVSNPESPAQLSHTPFPAVTFSQSGLSVNGSRAFTVDQWSGWLRIVDVTTPASPALLGQVQAGGGLPVAVSADGDFAAVADIFNGVFLYDVSDPAQPALVGQFDPPGSQIDVALRGTTAFVASSSALVSIDFSTPANPGMTTLLTGEPQLSLSTWDTTLAVGGTTGVTLMDIADPGSPTTIMSVSTPVQCAHLAVSSDGARLLAADGTRALTIHIADPMAPALSPPAIGWESIGAVAWAGDHPVLASSILEALYPDHNAPDPLRGELAMPARLVDTDPTTQTAYVLTTQGSVRTLVAIDVSDPAAPALLSEAPFPGPVGEVLVHNGVLYASRSGTPSTLEVYDLSNPSSPQWSASVPLPDTATSLKVHAGYLYAAGDSGVLGNAGITILSLANPLSPTLVRTVVTPGPAGMLVIDAGLALVADGDYGLRVYSMADPTLPALLGIYDVGGISDGDTRSVVSVGGYAAVLFDTDGRVLLDLSNPANPTPVPAQGWTRDTGRPILVGNLLVESRTSHIRMSDVSDPLHALPVARALVENIEDFVVVGETAYIASSTRGLVIVDLSDCPECHGADLNNDDQLNLDDLDLFIASFLTQDLLADCDASATLNLDDVDCFVEAFLTGCS